MKQKKSFPVRMIRRASGRSGVLLPGDHRAHRMFFPNKSQQEAGQGPPTQRHVLWYVPAIAMVGYGMGEIIITGIRFRSRYFRFNQKIMLTLFTLAVFYGAVLLIGEQAKTTSKDIRYWCQTCTEKTISSSIEGQFLTEIIQSNSKTNWIVTDSPIFAFRAGIAVPPATAVLSRKQLETGNITNGKLINIIEKYQPEQIFFKRFPWTEVTTYLQQNYQLTKQKNSDLYDFRLYVKVQEKANSRNQQQRDGQILSRSS